MIRSMTGYGRAETFLAGRKITIEMKSVNHRFLDVSLRLRRYALNRWQRNARVQERSLRNGRIFHSTGLMRWGRDLSLRALGGRIMDVPWLYEGSA